MSSSLLEEEELEVLVSRNDLQTLTVGNKGVIAMDCKRLREISFEKKEEEEEEREPLSLLEIRWCHALTIKGGGKFFGRGEFKRVKLESVLLLEGEEEEEPLGSSRKESPRKTEGFSLTLKDCRGTLNLEELPGLEYLTVTLPGLFPFLLKGKPLRPLKSLTVFGTLGTTLGRKDEALLQEIIPCVKGCLTLVGLGVFRVTEYVYQYLKNSGVHVFLDGTVLERPWAKPWRLRKVRKEEEKEERGVKRQRKEEEEEKEEALPLCCVVCLEEEEKNPKGFFSCPYTCKSTVICENCVKRLKFRCPTCRLYTV